MSSIILKNYTTNETYDVPLMNEIDLLYNAVSVQSYAGGVPVTLPTAGRITISKADATATPVVISPAALWVFADGSSTYELTVQYESVTFACNTTGQLYYEVF